MYKRSIAVIANAKHTKKIKSIEKELESLSINASGFDITLFKSSVEVSIRQLAYEKAKNHEVLIAVGGDGTLHEVVNGIFDANMSATCIFGFIAAGSANDFQKTIQGAKSISEILQKFKLKSFSKIKLGCVLYLNSNGKEEKRYFLNIASLGMGYEVMREVNKNQVKMNADLSYFKAIAKTFVGYKNRQIRCTSDQWQWQGKIKLIAIANGKYFGSGLCIAPDASPLSPKLNTTIVGNVGLWTYLKKLLPLKLGKHIRHGQVFYKFCKEIEVNSEVACGIEADGEVIGTTPAKFFIAADALNILY